MKILSRIRSAFASASPPQTPPGPRSLLISGFGWSGSGALIDYAADYAGVGGFRNRFEEGSVLKGLYSLAVFYRGVAAKKPKTLADIEKLAEALSGRPGLSESIQPAREFVNIKRNEQMRRELGGERIDAIVAELALRLTARVDSATEIYRGDARDVQEAGTEFLDALKRASLEVRFKQPPQHLILNNDPPGYSVDLFKFHRNARYTVVTRDLADVFATLHALQRIKIDEKSLRTFMRAQRKKLAGFEETLLAESDAVKRDLVIVEFERFVSVGPVRDAWHEFCALSENRTGDKFDAAISVKNVGIGKALPDDVYRTLLDGVEGRRRELLDRLRKRSDVVVL